MDFHQILWLMYLQFRNMGKMLDSITFFDW